MSFLLCTKDAFGDRVTYADTLHRSYPDARDAVKRDLMLLGLRHAVRWVNETPYDVDPTSQTSVYAFLNSPESITRFFVQLRDDHRTDEAAHDLLERCRNGRDYEWPIDEEDEIALLLLAANDGQVAFEFRISEI